MADRRDPIDDLRALWAELETPEPDHSDAPRDERSGAAVDWLRATWDQLEAPPVEVPFVLRRRRVVRTAALLAVAAALLAGLSILLSGPRATDVAPAVPDGPRLAEAGPGDDSVHTAAERDDRVLDVFPDDDRTRTEIDAGGRLTLSRGSVQLVWVEPNESPSTDPAPRRENQENR
ncbi:hypothetical protein Pla163_05180 [Planctomycetes bacterium Pla163]|uniref:Uncharacterized protein n=1 Tax=Rohdeia mirabilis TaxID=2528008 RepID=A0A518CW13_9BACT|nr:hypothetical protein Pla163_05180 [Planctomycetes bacterium Pla163]